MLETIADRSTLSDSRSGATLAAARVADATERHAGRWDEFVEGRPEATFMHRFGWKRVLERAFGHRTHYLIAERAGRCVGVLPLAEVRSLLFGHALISTPKCVYGGPIASDQQARAALIDAACRRAEALRVEYLELRNFERMRPDWPCKELYVTFRKPIGAADDENLKAIPRKQRAMVRNGIQAGLVSRLDGGVRLVWDLYSESVRNLGTPVFSRRYFEILREEFADDCEVLIVEQKGDPIAGVMSFRFRDEILPYYAGSRGLARKLSANDFMYWEVMRRAAARGAGSFDFGRSKRETGSYRFKTHWGFEPTPLAYEYFLVTAKSVPHVSPTNRKYGLFVEAWRRLPLPVSRVVGPWLARSLG